ncbi:MAG: hypothetical protein JEZ02_03375 [Desulfatibacillum sp.]|nr:hypothetical protein [Desulfatibacillum sp.]
MKFRVLFIILLVLSLTLTGCGLPKDLKKEAETQNQQIMDQAMKIRERKVAFESFTKSNEFSKFASYAEREHWGEYFKEAQTLLNKSKTAYDQEVAPIVKNNKKDQVGELTVALAKVRAFLRTSNEFTEKVDKRIAFLKETMANAGAMVQKAEDDFSALNTRIEQSSIILEKAKADYPQKAEDINNRFAPIKKLAEETDTAMDKARNQLKKHTTEADADYAVLGDSCTAIGRNLSTEQSACAALEKRTGQLYHSYSKVLNDMRVDYFATVGRTSWDNNAEYDRDNDYIYPSRQVDEDTYELLAALPENTLLAGYRGNVYPAIDKIAWASLKINPTENMSSWDDEAQFWLSDLDAKFYHKYIMLEDGVKKETDWVPVDEDLFDQYEEALGMTILSKPYGMYEDEILSQATPPGMAYVDNPKYGEWQQDSSGRSFWHWYGQYAFFRTIMGGGYYYRGDYDRWNRNYRGRQPYYGTGSNTYGTNSPYGRKHYSGSYYGKSGGFSTQSPTVRGSGAAARGGGPGGAGK